MRARLTLLACAAALACALFMTLGVRAPWDFVLPFRGAKLAALILVAICVSTATVLFQTITENRILTPSIMGFDALYVLILTGAVLFFGGRAVAQTSDQIVFAVSLAVLLLASLVLFGTLLAQARSDLLRMVLTGIIFGLLFHSLRAFMQRLIDPNEYAVVQVASFARFNQIEVDLLAISALCTGAALLWAWRLRHPLDVLALGHDAAVNLGVTPRRLRFASLAIISILVSVSTALVGPVAFLGLLVVSLARLVTPTERHAVLLQSAGLIAVVVLVGGQTVLERVLNLSTPLSVVIDLVGGVVFLLLLLREVRR